MSKKVMRLLDPSTGLMECKICGRMHFANRGRGGYFLRGSWQCLNGCRLEDFELEAEEREKSAPEPDSQFRP
jgi:hypothetical protein